MPKLTTEQEVFLLARKFAEETTVQLKTCRYDTQKMYLIEAQFVKFMEEVDKLKNAN